MFHQSELEQRSKYHMQIKADVETHKDMINQISREIKSFNTLERNTCTADKKSPTPELCDFMKSVDTRLSCLIDEHAVLKNFPTFPEVKLDVLREANGLAREMTKIQADFKQWGSNSWDDIAMYFQYSVAKLKDDTEIEEEMDDVKQPIGDSGPLTHYEILKKAIKIMDAAQPRLDDVDRNAEQRTKKYAAYGILYDSLIVTHTKHAAVSIASSVIGSALVLLSKRITDESNGGSDHHSSIVAPALKLAYRIYQLASGFDDNAAALFNMLCEYS